MVVKLEPVARVHSSKSCAPTEVKKLIKLLIVPSDTTATCVCHSNMGRLFAAAATRWQQKLQKVEGSGPVCA